MTGLDMSQGLTCHSKNKHMKHLCYKSRPFGTSIFDTQGDDYASWMVEDRGWKIEAGR